MKKLSIVKQSKSIEDRIESVLEIESELGLPKGFLSNPFISLEAVNVTAKELKKSAIEVTKSKSRQWHNRIFFMIRKLEKFEGYNDAPMSYRGMKCAQ